MEKDLNRNDYEKPRGIVVCDLHVKRDQIMREADIKQGKLIRRMNVLTMTNIGVCVLSVFTLVLVLVMLSKHVAPMAFGG
jgi:hypothetical protein